MSVDRRAFLRTLPVFAAAPLAASLGACSREPLTGPGEIHWDRDTCERCSMVISDRHFAAQIRDPMKKLHKFDDFGDAVFFLEHQNWAEASIEFWIADSRDGRWLDARKVRYVGGKRTPMLYGFGAVAEAVEGSVSYEEAKKLILAKGK